MTETLAILPNGLKAHIYSWSDLSDTKEVVLCFPGLPNYPEKEFFESIPENLRKFTFIVVYYYGYWFSDGQLTVESSVKSVLDSVAATLNGQLIEASSGKEIFSSIEKISLIGYSFGANPLSRSLQSLLPFQEKIVDISFIAPLGLMHKDQLSNIEITKLNKFYNFNKSFLNFLYIGYNCILQMKPKKEWNDFFQGRNKKSILKNVPTAFSSKIKVYYGADDKMLDREFINAFVKVLATNNLNIYENIGHSKSLILKYLLQRLTDQ